MATSTPKLLQCYNKGCGLQFEENKNHPDACLHHPGQPFFHDAYKGWSCCNKKCTDFTEFLNIKGCSKSYHSNVKPPEPERAKANDTNPEEVIVYEPPKLAEPLPRPREDTPMTTLPVTVAPSLKQMLEKLKLEHTEVLQDTNTEQVISPGTSCKSGGCKVEYVDEKSNSEICMYHPGVPIFHEGLKYWSCCQKKTTDFNNFLDQEGCTAGHHVWIKKDSKEKVPCRYDWHQTGGFVYISIYTKGAKPDESCIKANAVKLSIFISFGQGSVFETDLVLKGVIDVEKSSVSMANTKVEIKLKKAEPVSWDKLAIPVQVQTVPKKPKEDKKEEILRDLESNSDSDDIDLSDL